MGESMSINEYVKFNEFKQGLVFRIALFCFIGLGWDVLMTTLQQIISGKLSINALNPASTWMFLAYGSIPFLFYPVTQFGRFLKLPYAGRVAIVLLVFYTVEFMFGFTLRTFGITPWNYDWFLDPSWSLFGIITWHPVIFAAWVVFVILVEWIDSTIRKSYPAIQTNLASFWRSL
jgi:hypothetical protein